MKNPSNQLPGARNQSAEDLGAAAPGAHAPAALASPHPDGIESAKIAIVDDEPINIKVVRKYLTGAGYTNIVTTTDSASAMEMLRRERPDVLLLDVMMPSVNGIEILQQVREDGQLQYLPVLILTASNDQQTKLTCLNSGANDFLAKPVDPNDLLPRLRNTLILKAHQDRLSNYSADLERQVRARTVELELSRLQVIYCLARAAECRDDATGRHVIRVGRYCTVLARGLGFSNSEATLLGMAAQLHDVGKIALPDSILLKPGELTEAEFARVKRHCDIGQNIVQPLNDEAWQALRHCSDFDLGIQTPSRDPLLVMVSNIAHTHHERWDGKGYPRGLAGEAIPLEGRITCVADVFDALASQRPYKDAFPTDECLSLMEQGRGTQFDPRVLDVLLRRIDEFLVIREEQADERAAA
jgi:putative two-component system response regulator